MNDLAVSNVGNVVYEVPAHLIVVGNNQRLEGNTGFTDQSLKALADSIVTHRSLVSDEVWVPLSKVVKLIEGEKP